MNPTMVPEAAPALVTPVFEDADTPVLAGARAVRRRVVSQAPPRPPVGQILAIGGVVLLGLLVLVGVGELSGHRLLIPSMAGTMALVAAAPRFVLAQPRNVILGQSLAAAIGLGVGFVHHSVWAAAVSAALTVVVTLIARCAHAPAAATAVVATVTVADRGVFLLCAVSAAVVIVVAAAATARCTRQEYPAYWW